ncbi:glycosyl transferase, family 2 [Chitinispirillum alkaliphilum]|nr:glycosyl transferase, family 2 [Chitinispirillum alkaliphilum]
MPRISVIIPVYNRSGFIGRAIKSVLTQDFSDFELIVVDDGSSDSTADAISSFSNLRTLSLSENRGVSCARNRGVEISNGQWIAFLDSDDQWLPSKLREQMEWLSQNPSINILQSREIWIRNGRRVNPPRAFEKKQGDLFFESLERCSITPSSVLLKRELFDLHKGFDETLPACEDYDLWLRITIAEKVGLVQKNHLIRYGGHPDQLSSSVPCQDKFRVYAIEKILSSYNLDELKRQRAVQALQKKAAIIANGALKRGNLNDYKKYSAIAGKETFGSDKLYPGAYNAKSATEQDSSSRGPVLLS